MIVRRLLDCLRFLRQVLLLGLNAVDEILDELYEVCNLLRCQRNLLSVRSSSVSVNEVMTDLNGRQEFLHVLRKLNTECVPIQPGNIAQPVP